MASVTIAISTFALVGVSPPSCASIPTVAISIPVLPSVTVVMLPIVHVSVSTATTGRFATIGSPPVVAPLPSIPLGAAPPPVVSGVAYGTFLRRIDVATIAIDAATGPAPLRTMAMTVPIPRASSASRSPVRTAARFSPLSVAMGFRAPVLRSVVSAADPSMVVAVAIAVVVVVSFLLRSLATVVVSFAGAAPV